MNRRQFCSAGLATLAAACKLPPARIATPRPAAVPVSALRRLVVARTDPVLGRCRYVAELAGRTIPQPILVARRGEQFDAVIENALPQPTTVHFHGLTLPEAADGAGFDPIAPGARQRVRFEVQNRSGLYWFHPHAHGFTAEQVYGGLTGLLVVTDEDDEALDAALGLAPGNRLALAIADVRVAGGVIRPYAPSAQECLHGWFGNRALVSGALDAHWPVAPGWVRLQLLNACNARGLLLAFRDGARPVPFHLLGSDGGLLGAPRALERVFLYTGERVDVAIDVRRRSALAAISLAFDPRHHHGQGTVPAHRHPARGLHPPLSAASVCDSAPGDTLPDGAELPLFTLQVASGGGDAMPPLP
ncbi:MAG: multicopper oxidase family protein, partial [Burkholderiales bacterium]